MPCRHRCLGKVYRIWGGTNAAIRSGFPLKFGIPLREGASAPDLWHPQPVRGSSDELRSPEWGNGSVMQFALRAASVDDARALAELFAAVAEERNWGAPIERRTAT